MKNISVRKVLNQLVSLSRPALLAIAGILGLSLLYIYRLSSLTRGVDDTEFAVLQTLRADSLSLLDIARNAIDLPQQLGIFILQFTPFQQAGSVRLFSAVLAIAAAVSIYILLRHWHTMRIALLGTALFAASGWLLHIGRYGGPDILYVLPLIVAASIVYLQEHRQSRVALAVLCVAAAMSLYVPGLLVLALPLIIWQRTLVTRLLRNARLESVVFGGIISVVLLLPLLLSIIWPADDSSAVTFVRTLFAIPESLPSVSNYGTNIWHTIQTVFMGGGPSSWLRIGNLPLLDVFTSAMVLLGLYVAITDWGLDRSKVLIIGVTVCLLLLGLGGPVSTAILLPFIYVLAASGMRYMLAEWFGVFPRNPLAKWTAVGLLAAAVTVVSWYHLTSYFVAWPNLPSTRSMFTQRP